MDTNQAIQNIQNLDLKDATKEDVHKEVRNLGRLGQMAIRVPKGTNIYRARPNKVKNGNYETFNTKEVLSYAPIDCKNEDSFGRASLPNNTVFYGSLPPINHQEEMGIDNEHSSDPQELRPELITIAESLPWSRYPDINGYQKFTISKWRLEEDLILATGGLHRASKNPTIQEWREDLLSNTESKLPGEKESIIKKNEFIADQFSKEVPDGEEHEYKISAVLTDR
ncbi:MAG: hypothetical protein ABEH43_04615, partial [Flavobacteriales bacterium]